MGKKEISFKNRKNAIIVLILLSAFAASSLIVFGIIGIEVKNNVQTSSYGTKSEIKYKLNFLDDPLYNKEIIDFGEGYVTKFISDIDLNFLYDFVSDNATNISGNYVATALLEATYNEKDLIWKKEYMIIPETAFNTGSVSESAKLPLKEYIDFADDLRENSGVTTSVNLTVTYTSNVTALIDGKEITETSESTLVLPIADSVIVVGGNPLAEQSKTVESEVLQELFPKTPMLIVSSVFLFLLIGATIYLFVFTIGVRTNPIELELSKISKKYSSRLVALHSDSRVAEYESIAVSSFNDLLLVADEVRKPIFKNVGESCMGTEFFVFDEPIKYVFKAKYLKEVSKIEETGLPQSKAEPIISVTN